MEFTAAGKPVTAPIPPRSTTRLLPTAVALLAALVMPISACSRVSDEARLQSDTVVPPVAPSPPAGADDEAMSTADRPTTTADPPPTAGDGATTTDPGAGEQSAPEPPTSQPSAASAEAESFKAVAATIGELGTDVQGFVAATRPIRIDQLASRACSDLSIDMTDGDLGMAGLAMYRQLPDDEQAMISVTGWSGLYGALIGFFCPDRLPGPDAGPPEPADEPGIEQFRALMAGFAGASEETRTFVAGLDDRRLDQLQASACDGTDENMNTEQFGFVIVESYDAALSAAESAEITLSGFSELYGSLVGWFCPEKLPR